MPTGDPFLLLNLLAASQLAFAVLCLADHGFHRMAAKEKPTSGEWLTHFIIFIASTATNLSVLLLLVNRHVALLVFGSCFMVKVVHEMVDECKWHLPRCGRTESMIHLGMLINAQVAPLALFLFGWLYDFKGIEQMPALWWAAVLAGSIGLTVFSIGECQLFFGGLKHEAK